MYDGFVETVHTHVQQKNSNQHPPPHRWADLAVKYPTTVAIHDPHHDNVQLTFAELRAAMLRFAAGLAALGLQRGDKVSLFSENSARWLIADQGVMLNGAADAVCGVLRG